MFIHSSKLIVGAPPNAQKMKYIRILAQHYGHPYYTNLSQAVDAAEALLQQNDRKYTA